MDTEEYELIIAAHVIRIDCKAFTQTASRHVPANFERQRNLREGVSTISRLQYCAVLGVPIVRIEPNSKVEIVGLNGVSCESV